MESIGSNSTGVLGQGTFDDTGVFQPVHNLPSRLDGATSGGRLAGAWEGSRVFLWGDLCPLDPSSLRDASSLTTAGCASTPIECVSVWVDAHVHAVRCGWSSVAVITSESIELTGPDFGGRDVPLNCFVWGTNRDGELGFQHNRSVTSFTRVTLPAAVLGSIVGAMPPPLSTLSLRVLDASFGQSHACIVVQAVSVDSDYIHTYWLAAGSNRHGQLGVPAGVPAETPEAAPFLSSSSFVIAHACVTKRGRLDATPAVACGWQHTIALTPECEVWSWGSNRRGQCGRGGSERVVPPGRVCIEGRVCQVSSGWSHSAAVVTHPAPGVLTWGRDDMGALCRDTTSSSTGSIASSLPGLVPVASFFDGDDHARIFLAAALGSEHTIIALHIGDVTSTTGIKSSSRTVVLGGGWNEHGNLGASWTPSIPPSLGLIAELEGRVQPVAGGATTLLLHLQPAPHAASEG